MEQENIRFEKSDLQPDIVKVKVGKDGAFLMPPVTLTVKIDYSDRVCNADHYNATKLASSVLPVSSISPFRVEMCKNRLPFRVPVIFKRNTYNIGQLGIPSPNAFLSAVHKDFIASPKNNNMAKEEYEEIKKDIYKTQE